MYCFDVFGGCVSRDLFESSNSLGKVVNYFARTSLVSQFSPSLEIQANDFELASKFQKRMLLNDFNKEFFQYLKRGPNAEFIIFDFLVERLNLIKYNSTFFTCSNEFRKCGLNLDGDIVSKDEHLILIESAIQDLSKLFGGYKFVFLNKFYHATNYVDGNGDLIEFENQQYISRQNLFLDKIYTMFEKYIDGVVVIESELTVADVNHKWGLASYHFESRFYENVNKKIKDFLNSNC